MTEELFTIFFFFIIIGTPFCGAQECQYNKRENTCTCRNIVDQFPVLFYDHFHLKCEDCFVKTFSKNTFPYEINLRSFDLSNGGLRHVESGSFTKLDGLEYLHLEHNGLVNVSADAFDGLNQLFELHLEDNMVQILQPGFLNGCSCNYVNLSNNALEDLPAEVFKGSTSLLTLNLSANKISTIHKDAFLGLLDLEDLDLAHNKLCFVPLGTFRTLDALLRLDLANNAFAKFSIGTFSGLKNLDFLTLANNKLSDFDSTMLLPMMRLAKLDISGNSNYILNANEILLNAPTLKAISLEDNIFSCDFLKEMLQFFKGRSVRIENNVFRYEHCNINGIACVEGFAMIDSISLEEFLNVAKERANWLTSSC